MNNTISFVNDDGWIKKKLEPERTLKKVLKFIFFIYSSFLTEQIILFILGTDRIRIFNHIFDKF